MQNGKKFKKFKKFKNRISGLRHFRENNHEKELLRGKKVKVPKNVKLLRVYK